MITIGLAAYGNLNTTKSAINAIKKSIKEDFEIILVDDHSPDNGKIKEYFLSLKNDFQQIKVFSFQENLGYTHSVNCILSNSICEKILFVSNDIFINEYFINELVNISSLIQNVGYVRGVSNFVDGYLDTHNVNFKGKSYEDSVTFAKKQYLLEKNNFYEEKYLTGDCFLINKKLIKEIGYFDYFNFKDYFGDVDFSIRAMKSNFKCLLSKGAFCYHDKHVNFNYLTAKEKERKIFRRRYFTIEDWARFKIKYDLPNNLMYPGINKIDFENIKKKSLKKSYIKNLDYSEYLI